MDLLKEPSFQEPVFITGLTRSGKILLCELLTCFQEAEKVNVDFTLEQIPELHHLGKISDESARYLIIDIINQKFYYNLITRDINFRVGDYTSIWNYHKPLKYIFRAFVKENKILQSYGEEQSLFHLMLHNGLWHSKIFFDSFPNLKMLNMVRDPVDIVYSWHKKGYEGSYYEANKIKPMCLTYSYKGERLPYYVYGWESSFLASSGIDRIINLVEKIRGFHATVYNSLGSKNKDRILLVNHKTLASDTRNELERIGGFLGRETLKNSRRLSNILKKNNCPRDFLEKDRELKLATIQKNASEEAFKKLMKQSNDFNKKINYI